MNRRFTLLALAAVPGLVLWAAPTGAATEASVRGFEVTCPEGWGKTVEVWADTGRREEYCTPPATQQSSPAGPEPTLTAAPAPSSSSAAPAPSGSSASTSSGSEAAPAAPVQTTAAAPTSTSTVTPTPTPTRTALPDWSNSVIFESLAGGPSWTGSGASSLGDQITCPDGWGKAVEVWADTGRQAVYCVRQVPQPMPTIVKATGDDPLPQVSLGQAIPGYTLTSGADPNAGAALSCPTGSGPAVTGNGYSVNRNEWTWSCIKNWVDANTVAEPTTAPTTDPSGDATTTPPSGDATTTVANDSTTQATSLAVAGSVEVSIAARSLVVGDVVTVKAMRGKKVVKRWTIHATKVGKATVRVPRALRGMRIVMTSGGKTLFNRVVR